MNFNISLKIITIPTGDVHNTNITVQDNPAYAPTAGFTTLQDDPAYASISNTVSVDDDTVYTYASNNSFNLYSTINY